MSRFKLGIDLGGTKIEAAILDEKGELVWGRRIDTPVNDYQALLAGIHDLVFHAEDEVSEELPVGICTPVGRSPQAGLMRNSNITCMNGKNLLHDLSLKLERPLRIQNDANCFALSEAMDGTAADYDMVFGVIIGTGVGGGLVWRKKLITGPHAIAGEWGHNPMPWTQPFDKLRDCFCGKQGCIETFLSGPGLSGNTKALTGMTLDSHDIVARAEQGDQQCALMMDHYYDQMARGLAHVINIVDPDVIVLGGGMSNIQGIYQQVPERLQQYVFSDFVVTKILAPQYGDSSGVRGAAWLWD